MLKVPVPGRSWRDFYCLHVSSTGGLQRYWAENRHPKNHPAADALSVPWVHHVDMKV